MGPDRGIEGNSEAQDIHHGLNQEQLNAVHAIQGPVIIEAGAGTGKTRTLIHRVAQMLREGIAPANILLLTFTNKAAGEIVERLMGMIGESAENVVAGTFHSVLLRHALRAYPQSRTLRDIGCDPARLSIHDEKESREHLRAAVNALPDELIQQMQENEWNVAKLSRIIGLSRARGAGFEVMVEARRLNEGSGSRGALSSRLPRAWAVVMEVARARLPRGGHSDRMAQTLAGIALHTWVNYERIGRQMGGVDFDDILIATGRMIEAEPDIRRDLTARFRYIMVDEFQDTNPAQLGILRSLAAERRNICVVGDPRQGIYGFRGAASSEAYGFMQTEFPESKWLSLPMTYRCQRDVIALANKLCASSGMMGHLDTADLVPGTDKAGQMPVFAEFGREEDEAADIARSIEGYRGKGSVAVIYRKRSVKDELEKTLARRGVRYRVVGDRSFFERKEVSNAIALLRMIFTPWDSSACKRVVRATSMGVSWDTVLREMKSAGNATAMQCLLRLSKQTKKSGFRRGEQPPPTKSAARLTPLLGLCEQLRAHVESLDDIEKIASVFQAVWNCYFFKQMEADVRRSDAENPHQALKDRMGNVERVFFMFLKEIEKGRDPVETVEELFTFSKGQDGEDPDHPHDVELMTIHAVKGKEYDKVIIIGMEQETLFGANPSDEEKAEVARLVYVGMTRAIHDLVLTCCDTRREHGGYQAMTRCELVTDEMMGMMRRVDRRKSLRTRHDSSAANAGRSGRGAGGRLAYS